MDNKIERNSRKVFEGVVVSDRMNKTRVVSVARIYRDPLYEKTIRSNKKYYAHDEANESKTGDRVEIVATRPLSRLKRWRISKIITKKANNRR